MKIRDGFVSNSSSSSFCIIGTTDRRAIAELIKAEGKNFPHYDENDDYVEGEDYLGYGMDSGKVVNFYGSSEVGYVGVDAEELLQTTTIPEARKAFQKLVKQKLKVEIPLGSIQFHYGEVGEG